MLPLLPPVDRRRVAQVTRKRLTAVNLESLEWCYSGHALKIVTRTIVTHQARLARRTEACFATARKRAFGASGLGSDKAFPAPERGVRAVTFKQVAKRVVARHQTILTSPAIARQTVAGRQAIAG